MRIAVAGNPNAGKTTLFNLLTGARAKVANYPGVTIERREAHRRLPSGRAAQFIDLPGCYSLTARSPEEEVAHHVLVGALGDGRPDVVICVVDATSLARGLYLVLQLVEMGLGVVVALNMMDLAAAQGIHIDAGELSRRLGLPVIRTAARFGQGSAELLEAVELFSTDGMRHNPSPAALDEALATSAEAGATQREPSQGPEPSGAVPAGPEAHPPRMGGETAPQTSRTAARGARLRLSERDENAVQAVRNALHQSGKPHSLGEGLWLLSSNLDEVQLHIDDGMRRLVTHHQEKVDPAGSGDFNRRVITARYRLIDEVLDGVLDMQHRREDQHTRAIDRVLLHPVWGMAVFVGTMFVLFQAVFAWVNPVINGIAWLMAQLSAGIAAVLPAGLVRSLLVDGVIAGIGNILAFLPQIALLFLGLAILEESGYMARAAFLLDALMRRVGLHGKAFIPLMSSFACAVPGVMASRTVESSRDRLVTIMVAPFMSCSARLPVYVMVIGAVFAASAPVWGFLSLGGLVIAAMYFLGFAAAIFTAWLLKRTALKSPTPALLLELPPYRMPTLRAVWTRVFGRCRVFVSQTGTVILALSMLLWGMLTFPRGGMDPAEYQAHLHAIDQTVAAQHLTTTQRGALVAHLAHENQAVHLEHTIGGRLGHLIEPVIKPLGFDWRIGVGLIASFAAREVLVSTLGQVYALDSHVEANSPALRDALRADVNPKTGKPFFTPLVGLSLMVFFVLAMQCLSTVATVRRETNSWRWPLFQIAYMNTLAYLVSLGVFQIGMAMGWGT